MKFKNKSLLKVAGTLAVAAFSFGLSLSCVSNVNRNNGSVFAADAQATWSYNSNNKTLSCQSVSAYPSGFIDSATQTQVVGRGTGQYEITYNVQGYASGAMQSSTDDFGDFTLVFINGSYERLSDQAAPYGIITAYPNDIDGLDSETPYEIYVNVLPSGDMNEQGSGGGDDENAGTWTWNENTQKLSFQFNDTATAGYVSQTSQTMVYGHGNGTFDIGYDLYGTPANATTASNELLASKTITLYDGYYNSNYDNPAASEATITGSAGAISGLESYYQITIKVEVQTSGDMNTDGWRVNDGQLYYYSLAEEFQTSIDSITWNNSSGNGTGEAILSVTYSTDGGSTTSQQAYQINNPTFSPELEGTSGTTSGNTTVEGIAEFSDRYVIIDIPNTTYSLGGSTQDSGWSYTEGVLTYYSNEFGPTTFEYHTEAGGSQVPYCIGNTAVVETYDGQNQATISFSFYNESDEEVPVENGVLVLTDAGYSKVEQNLYSVTGTCEGLADEPLTIYVQSVETSSPDDPTTEQYRYNIMFDGNGSTGGSMSSVEFYSENESADYELPECAYQRDGYTFVGWGFTDDTVITYQPGEIRSVSSGDTIFYAIWAQQLTITFEANGGSGNMDPLVVAKGSRQTVPECSFVREGYSFLCWAVGSTESSMTITPGQSVTVDQNYVLYAVWQPNNATIQIEEDEVVVYVGEEYLMQYKILPEGYEASIFATVEQERVAEVYVEGEIFIYGLSAGTTKVTLSNESGSLTKSFTLYVVEPPEPVEPENKIDEQTIVEVNTELSDASLGLSEEQIKQITDFIDDNKNYISNDAGNIVSQALGNTTIDSSKDYADAQKSLVVTVVETGLMVDAGKATSLSGAQEIDKALPSDANFSVESEIDEFYQRQMVELFGGQMPSRRIVRAETPVREIDIDPKGREGTEAIEYLGNEETLYKKMVGFVDNSVDHMGKAALKIRKCSGESVVVQVKSYVTVVKVSSFRDFDKEAADKEFVEAAYKAIMLSMQNEVISILEKEHEPSNNAEKEAQYQKELDAVKDYETFEIMVTEVLRQKYNTLVEEPIDDVDEFKPVYREIFEAWALDKQSKYGITLEELTKATIEQSTNRARTFTVHSDLSTNEWIFIGAIAGGAVLVITAAAVIPTLLKKKKAKEGIN